MCADGKPKRKTELEDMQAEANRFRLSAVYNESKRVMQLLEQTIQGHDIDTGLLNCEFCQKQFFRFVEMIKSIS